MDSWLSFISKFGPFIASTAAFIAAIAAGLTARQTRNLVLAQASVQILTAYGSSEMLKGMRNLADWKRAIGPDFARIFAELWRNSYRDVKDLDEDRRRISHYFYMIGVLIEIGVIKEAYAKRVVPSDGIRFLLNTVEPLEREINPDYNRKMFRRFRRLLRKWTC